MRILGANAGSEAAVDLSGIYTSVAVRRDAMETTNIDRTRSLIDIGNFHNAALP